jgi:hypothetical protein
MELPRPPATVLAAMSRRSTQAVSQLIRPEWTHAIHDPCGQSGWGKVDLSDAIKILNFLFRGGPPPLPPYPNCGDAEAPEVDCDSLTSCA